jgi:LPS export ABC transporter permease LptG
MVCVFLIFTLFELLRYMNGTAAKFSLLLRYLFFLIPMASVSIAPIGMLVAVLVTYALMARRSESFAWWAAGQSIYRLAVPCVSCALIVAAGLWMCQERVLPGANQRQEALRAQIRGGPAQVTTTIGRQWLALPTPANIYAYTYDVDAGGLAFPAVFEFDAQGVHVQQIVMGTRGFWRGPNRLEIEQAEVLDLAQDSLSGWRHADTLLLTGAPSQDLFKPLLSKPTELNTNALSDYIKTLALQRGVDARPYEIALAQRWAVPLAPVVMALLGLPLALAVGRRTALTALSAAVMTGLAFWGSVSGFQQLGQYQLLPPPVAAWAPLLLFLVVAAYLLARART